VKPCNDPATAGPSSALLYFPYASGNGSLQHAHVGERTGKMFGFFAGPVTPCRARIASTDKCLLPLPEGLEDSDGKILLARAREPNWLTHVSELLVAHA
jgi:hypothetical protein